MKFSIKEQQELIEVEIRMLQDMKKIVPYLSLKHAPYCNLMQNWHEAQDAFDSTPHEYRDEDYYGGLEELQRLKSTCTCGLIEATKDNLLIKNQ